MGMRPRRLSLESLEPRQLFVVEINVAPPVVSTFPASAEVTGLAVTVAEQPIHQITIDSAGQRYVIREIDGMLYSFAGSTVYLTDMGSGSTTTRTLAKLPGTAAIEVKDIALVDGEVTIVGGSTTGDPRPTKRSIATRWDSNGSPTRVGPAATTGIANFISSAGLIGGYYENSPSEYSPWINTPLGDFDLPVEGSAATEQMVTGASPSGAYLAGFQGDAPLVWQAIDSPEQGNYQLIVSPGMPLQYPAEASVGAAGSRYLVLDDASGSVRIFGQYEVPVFNQGTQVGVEPHAAVWSDIGERLFDFGAGTEMRGAVSIGTSFIVAHRDAFTLFDQAGAQTIRLEDLLGVQPGVTRSIRERGILLVGSSDQPKLGINYQETASGVTQSKMAIVPLKQPELLEIDIESDGQIDLQFTGIEMAAPTFVSIGHGPRTLTARVTFSDGSIAAAVTTYESLAFDSIVSDDRNLLRIGGTAGDDLAALTQLGANSYRATVGDLTGDFDNIDSVILDLAGGNDRLALAGGMVIELTNLAGVETMDAVGPTSETIAGIDALAVQFQVGEMGTLRLNIDPQDIVQLSTDWTVQAPEMIDGRAAARMTDAGITVLVVSGNFNNPVRPLDVSFDNFVTARDALLVINHLNQVSGGANPTIEAYLDVNNNGFITALDVLLIINFINAGSVGEGEQPWSGGPNLAGQNPSDAWPPSYNVDLSTLLVDTDTSLRNRRRR